MDIPFDVKRIIKNNIFNKDSFIKVYSFSSEFNDKISDALYTKYSDYSLYFSNNGNIGIYEQEKLKFVNKFLNPLINTDDLSTSSLLITLDEKLKNRSIYQNYFISKNGKWLLYDNGKKEFLLLYNTVYHPGFTNYYKNFSNNISDNLFLKYCKHINMIDDACSCINYDEDDICLNSFLGENIPSSLKTSSPQLYNTFKTNCVCLNSKCQNLYNSNLLDNTYTKTRFECKTPPNINICASILNSTDNSNLSITGDLNTKFNCGITDISGSGASAAGGNTSGSGASAAVPKPVEPQSTIQKRLDENKNKIYIGGGILGLILIISIVYISSKKSVS